MSPVIEAPPGAAQAPSRLPPDGPEQGVIEEARRRQRNRRFLLGGIGAAAILVAGLAHLGAGGAAPKPRPTAPHPRAATPTRPAASSRLLAQPPDIGVACGVPNYVGCDRVGLAVWLRRPAVSVNATIAGRPLTLADPTWSGPARDGRRTLFAGFLQPAGLARLGVRADATGRWYGAGAPSPTVRLSIDYGQGQHATTELSVLVTAGWG